jgi:hypothetical protein
VDHPDPPKREEQFSATATSPLQWASCNTAALLSHCTGAIITALAYLDNDAKAQDARGKDEKANAMPDEKQDLFGVPSTEIDVRLDRARTSSRRLRLPRNPYTDFMSYPWYEDLISCSFVKSSRLPPSPSGSSPN